MASDAVGPKLGDVVTLIRGTTYKGQLLGQPGPVLLGLASIQRNGGFRNDALKTYGGECKPKLILGPGELYVSLKDVTQSADLLGAVARVPDFIAAGRLTQDTVKLEFSGGSYPHNLLYWALRSPSYRSYCREHATGTTTLGLAREDFLSFSLPASTADRLGLVELLEALESRIRTLAETNTTLEAIAQALFKSWFVDFDPVRAKAEGLTPAGMDADTAALFPSEFEESELGLIPKGWREGALGEISTLNAESWSAKRSPDRIVYVDLSSVEKNQFSELAEHDFSDAPTRARRILRDRDSIVGTVRPGNRAFAYIHQPPANLTGSTGFAVLSPLDKVACGFIYLAATCNESIERLANLADGGAYPAVRPDVVSATPVIIPSDHALSTFGAVVNPLLEKIAENSEAARVLAQLRDTLLPRLISGKLRLPDAKALIEVAEA